MGVSPSIVNVVLTESASPALERMTEKLESVPVEITSLVPCGLPSLSNVTEMLVEKTLNPMTPGVTGNVNVEPVTVTGFVDPSAFKLPACSP